MPNDSNSAMVTPAPVAYPALTDLMLHRPPMLLLDRIIDSGSTRLVSEVRVTPDSPFYSPAIGGVPSWVGIEYIAQSVAALSGLSAHEALQPVELGMLISCRRYRVRVPCFKAGSLLLAEVSQLADGSTGMAAYWGTIMCEGEAGPSLAEGQLGVYQRSGTA